MGLKGEDRRRVLDRKFILRVRAAGIEELERLQRNHRHSDTPYWKKAAIGRAILRWARST